VAQKLGHAERVAATDVRVEFARDAIRDLADIRAYIGGFNPIAAEKISDRLLAAATGLMQFPLRGRLRTNGASELSAVFPYFIVYEVKAQTVAVLRVWHGARLRGD
jgi:plasmid stabilization system protein ParE